MTEIDRDEVTAPSPHEYVSTHSPGQKELESLVRRLRYERRALYTSGLALLILMTLTGLQKSGDPGRVRVSALILENNAHKPVAELTTDPAGFPILNMMDLEGHKRVVMSIDPDGSDLRMYDPDGSTTLGLSCLTGVTSQIELTQRGGRTMLLGVPGADPGEAFMSIFGSSEPATASDFELTISPTINDILISQPGRLSDILGPMIRLGVEKSGTTFMDFRDHNNTQRLIAEQLPGKEARVTTQDKNGRTVFSTPINGR